MSLLLVNGVSGITTELIFEHDLFFKESNLWPTEHHINHFVFMFEFGTTPIYLTVVENNIIITLFCFASSVGLSIYYFLCGEIIELTIRIIVNSSTQSNWFEGYSSETLEDVILSDGLQSILAAYESFLFIYCIQLTFQSSLLLIGKNKFQNFIIRFCIYLIFTISSFIGTIEKQFGDQDQDQIYRVGFFSIIFLKLSILCYFFSFAIKRIKMSDEISVNIQERMIINTISSYITLFMYLSIIYIPLILNLKYWGLFTSNGSVLILLFFLLVIKLLYRTTEK